MRGYGQGVQVQVDDAGRPVRFCWGGRWRLVVACLGRWQDRTAWWRQAPGAPPVLEASVWRLETAAGGERSIVDLRCEGASWTLVGLQD